MMNDEDMLGKLETGDKKGQEKPILNACGTMANTPENFYAKNNSATT